MMHARKRRVDLHNPQDGKPVNAHLKTSWDALCLSPRAVNASETFSLNSCGGNSARLRDECTEHDTGKIHLDFE